MSLFTVCVTTKWGMISKEILNLGSSTFRLLPWWAASCGMCFSGKDSGRKDKSMGIGLIDMEQTASLFHVKLALSAASSPSGKGFPLISLGRKMMMRLPV